MWRSLAVDPFAWGNRVLVLQKSTNTFIKDIPMDALLPDTLLKLRKFIIIVHLPSKEMDMGFNTSRYAVYTNTCIYPYTYLA